MKMWLTVIGVVLVVIGLAMLAAGFAIHDGFLAGGGAGLWSVAWNNVLPAGEDEVDILCRFHSTDSQDL